MIKKCECGSEKFTSFETLMVSGVIGDDGELLCKSDETLGIDNIIMCSECGKEYETKDFKRIEFIN